LADVFGRVDARGLELAGRPGAGIVHELGGSGLRRLGLLFDRTPARFDLCDKAIGSRVGHALDQAAQVLSKEPVDNVRDGNRCQYRIIWRKSDFVPPRNLIDDGLEVCCRLDCHDQVLDRQSHLLENLALHLP
jgi:hypothetical protein